MELCDSEWQQRLSTSLAVGIEERCSGCLLAENTSENALPSRTSVFSLWSMRDRLQLRTAIMENWTTDLRTIVREALKRKSA
jgi:hypothetical protein